LDIYQDHVSWVKTLQANALPPPVAKRQSPADNTGVFRISLGKNEETRLDAFERKGRRKILRVSRPAKRTNERVLNAAGANRELLDTVRARKLAYYGHTTRKQHTTIVFLVLGALHLDFVHRAHPNVTPLTAFVL